MSIIRMRVFTAVFCIVLAVPAIADDAENERLSRELNELRGKYDEQSVRLMRLEARVERLTFYNQSYTKPTYTIPTSPNGIVKAVYRGGNTQLAQGPTPEQQVKTPAKPSGAGEEEEVVKEAPASRSTKAVYQEQHALFDSKFTFEPGFTYSTFDRNQLVLNGFLALDAIFLGNISVDEVDAQILTLDLAGRYGATDRLQLDFNIPFVYRDTNYTSAGAGGASDEFIEEDVTLDPELGDVSAGFYYQLVKETHDWPDLVWNVRVKAPTGSDPYGIDIVEVPGSNGNLMIPEELSSGNGLWALSTGLSIARTIDPAILFASVNYTHNFEEDFDDISSAAGPDQPGSVELGATFSYGIGLAFALNERTSMSFGYSQNISEKSRQKFDGGGWEKITGSDANSAQLNIGATYALSDRSSWITNVGVGLNTDAPDVTFSMRFPYTF